MKSPTNSTHWCWTLGLMVAGCLSGCELASSGFNDVSGINGDRKADDIPFNVANVSVAGQGASEVGWAGPWSMGGSKADVVDDVLFEGDGALYFQNTTSATRKLAAVPTGPFRVDVRFMVPAGISRDLIFRILDPDVVSVTQATASQWAVMSDFTFQALDGNGDTTGTWKNTGFTVTPGVWHEVSTVIDPASETWFVSFDGQEFVPTTPLGFRGQPSKVDGIQYLNEINAPDGSYLDAVVITDAIDVTVLSAIGWRQQPAKKSDRPRK